MTSVERMLAAFEKICFVAAHYGMSDVFDHVVVTLIKFTNLLGANTETSPIQQVRSLHFKSHNLPPNLDFTSMIIFEDSHP